MQRHLANPDLRADSRRQLIELLNSTLASALDLSLQAKHAHWNVRGPEFVSFHGLFDDIAERLRHIGDVIAERATALGGIAQGTARLVSKNSQVSEYDLGAVAPQEHVEALAARMSLYAKDLKEAAQTASRLGDLATEDIFIEQLRALDMDTWFLDASSSPAPRAKRDVAEELPSTPPSHH
jgi:starvation-inducible DNA-binding protein